MKSPDFIVHDKADTVGVVVVENIKSGTKAKGHVMEDNSSLEIETRADIPLGHKIALGDIKSGDTIIKYGHDIGKATSDIKLGDHVHVQNVKTKKW